MLLSRLLYTSQCAIAGDDSERLAAVRDLAYSSSLTNGKSGLTGSLLYVDDCFIQVLEGHGDKIETLFERICCDFRHRDVRLIELSPIKERIFADWGMALLSESEQKLDREIMQEELGRIRTMVGVNAHTAVNEMRNFLREHEPA